MLRGVSPESGNHIATSYYIYLTKATIRRKCNSASCSFRSHGTNIIAAAHNDIFTETIGILWIDMVKKCVDKPGTESVMMGSVSSYYS